MGFKEFKKDTPPPPKTLSFRHLVLFHFFNSDFWITLPLTARLGWYGVTTDIGETDILSRTDFIALETVVTTDIGETDMLSETDFIALETIIIHFISYNTAE